MYSILLSLAQKTNEGEETVLIMISSILSINYTGYIYIHTHKVLWRQNPTSVLVTMPSPDTKPTALSAFTISRMSISLHFQHTKAMSDKERPLWMDPTHSFPPHHQWSTQWVTTNINPLTVPGISGEVQREVWLYSSIGPCTKSCLKSHFSLSMFHAQNPAWNPTFHAQSPAWNPTFHA